MAVRGILVDLDGTLVDTYPDLLACAKQALAKFAIQPVNTNTAELRRSVSGGARSLITTLAGRAVSEAVIEAMLDDYARQPVRESRLFAGTESWFALAPVVVVTNKSRRFAATIIEQLCPKNTKLVCPEDAQASKPDPAPLFLALNLLGIQATEAIYVGDDPRDATAAAAAKVPFVAALYGYGADLFDPSMISAAIYAPTELRLQLGIL